MKLRKSIVGFGGVVLAIVFATGLALNADAGSNCGAKTKADKASTSCSQAAAAGCTAAQAGACTAGMKATAAGCPGAASASSCPGAKAASAGCCSGMKTAESVMPTDAHMTRVDVPGGIDLVFTSADLGAVETFINAHMSMCGDEAGKSCGRTCSVTKTDQAVVLSVRGEDAAACCVGVMTATAMDQENDQAAPKASSQKS